MEEKMVTVTYGQVMGAPLLDSWTLMCEKYGINEWILNEGLADDEDTIEISVEDAILYGIINIYKK